MMKDPKYKVNDKVHIDGTSGIGRVSMIEKIAGKYMYHIEYIIYDAVDGKFKAGIKRKQCYEDALVLVDKGC